MCDPSLDIGALLKKNPAGTAKIRYHIFNNKTASAKINAVPEELKRFFTKGSDCEFGQLKPRPVPTEITGPAKR